MISASDADMGERLISLIPRGNQAPVIVHQAFLKDSMFRRSGRQAMEAWCLLVYTRKIPFENAETEEIGMLINRMLDRGEVPYFRIAADDDEMIQKYRSFGLKAGRNHYWMVP